MKKKGNKRGCPDLDSLPEIEGIRYTRSRSQNVINGICYQKCEIELKDVKKMIVSHKGCLFECSSDKETTKMIIYVNKVQNYWGFPGGMISIEDSKDTMGVGIRVSEKDQTMHLCSFGSWRGGHEGGCTVLYKIVFPHHIEKISRREEYGGGRLILEGFKAIDHWVPDGEEHDVHFDEKKLTPSEICYEKVEFMFSLEPFFAEVVNTKGGGVIGNIFQFLSIEDLLVSIPLVCKTFNLASKFVLLFTKNFSRAEYLYMLSYDYSGETGLGENILYPICKNNRNYDFGVHGPFIPNQKGNMNTLSFYFHKKFQNEAFLDLLLEKCDDGEGAARLGFEIYMGTSFDIKVSVIDKFLTRFPNMDTSENPFLYSCMAEGNNVEIPKKLINHPGFYKDKELHRDQYTTNSTVEHLIQKDCVELLVQFAEIVKPVKGDVFVEEVKHLNYSARNGSLACVKYFVNERKCRPNADTLNQAFDSLKDNHSKSGPPLELFKFLLEDPEFDPSPGLMTLFKEKESFVSEEDLREELTKLFLAHPKVTNGSVLGAYAGDIPDSFDNFKELFPKCSLEEKNGALLGGAIVAPSLPIITYFLEDEECRENLDFGAYFKGILKPPGEDAFWYEGDKFVGNNEILKKILETQGIKPITFDEDLIKDLVDTVNIEMINYCLGKNLIPLTLDLLSKIMNHHYSNKEEVSTFFFDNFEKIKLDEIDNENAFMLYRRCYEKNLRDFLLSKPEFMKKIRDTRVFEDFREDLGGLKKFLKVVDLVPNEGNVTRFCTANAADRGLDVLKWIVEEFKIPIHTDNNSALRGAVRWSRAGFAEYLLKRDPINVIPDVANLAYCVKNQAHATESVEKIVKMFIYDDGRVDPSVNDNEILKESIRISAECFRLLFTHPKVRQNMDLETLNFVLMKCGNLTKRDSYSLRDETPKGLEIIKIVLDDVEIVEKVVGRNDMGKIDKEFLCACVLNHSVGCIEYLVVEKKLVVSEEAMNKAEELNKTEILDILMKYRKK